ncbi:hypothetical protein H2204_008978 [Knufia peltigerae]|uniref:NACHT domain-containing protein n=1 Tax=Knufia peltigerae TaxID=1002370 RepID=A0AA39CWE2_9EURO|nr:hypothetical protein H2204_008978 [Knufia peltigerae]
MSFGFSIGDFLALVRLVEGTRKRFKGAPAEYAALVDETRTLQIVINDLKVQIEDDDLADSVKANLQSAATNCESVLVDLNAVIDSHTELDTVNSTTTKRTSRLWKRMKWDPAEASKLRLRLVSATQLLKAVLDGTQLNNIAQGVKTLAVAADAAEIRDIADWVAPATYSEWQNDYFSKILPGTGQWILTDPSYRDWRNGDLANLFFDGHPGVGKTFLASMLIDDLQTYTSQSDTLALAYFYSSFRRHEIQSPVDIISSLLRQLFLHQSGKAHAVRDMFNKYKGIEKRPGWTELCQTLESTLRGSHTAFFVIDALDECEGPNEEGGKPWHRVFELLFRLQAALKPQVGIRILATFRPFVTIDGVPENHKRQHIEASSHDLETFCRATIPNITCIAKKPELHLRIIQEVCEGAQGMFLLAKLHCDTLSAKTKPKDILKALDEFKKTGNIGDTLTRAYEDSLRRIQCQPEEHRDLARKVFICVTFSFRLLTINELRHAIGVDKDTKEIDPEYDLDDPDLMISVCAGLVTLDTQSQVIRTVHYTTQTFLESLDNGFLSNPHTLLASCCLSYLQLSLFATGSGYDLSGGILSVRQSKWQSGRRKFPFRSYSARFWATHWERSRLDPALQQQVFSFLDNFGFVASACIAMQPPSHIHLLASMGTNAVLKTYLERGEPAGSMQNADMECKKCKRIPSSHIDRLERRQCSWQEAITSLKDSRGRTALFYTAEKGHLLTMEALHHAKKDMLNESDSNGSTVLMHALRYSDGSSVLGLLRKSEVLGSGFRININSQDDVGRTALTVAVSDGSLEHVKLLTCTHEADVDLADIGGRTPIMWAALCRRIDIVIFLAPLVSDINQPRPLGTNRVPSSTARSWTIIYRPPQEDFERLECLSDVSSKVWRGSAPGKSEGNFSSRNTMQTGGGGNRPALGSGTIGCRQAAEGNRTVFAFT